MGNYLWFKYIFIKQLAYKKRLIQGPFAKSGCGGSQVDRWLDGGLGTG